jgi:hypothetical protein
MQIDYSTWPRGLRRVELKQKQFALEMIEEKVRLERAQARDFRVHGLTALAEVHEDLVLFLEGRQRQLIVHVDRLLLLAAADEAAEEEAADEIDGDADTVELEVVR